MCLPSAYFSKGTIRGPLTALVHPNEEIAAVRHHRGDVVCKSFRPKEENDKVTHNVLSPEEGPSGPKP